MRAKSVCLVALLSVVPCLTRAQQFSGKVAVVSVQPLSTMLTFYSGEAELAMSRSASLGVGASYWSPDVSDGSARYMSGDLKIRFYPEGRPFQGFSFGGSLGVTHVSAKDSDSSGDATGGSIGVMLDYGWLLGEQKSFYVGLGAGAKTLFISDQSVADNVTLHYPTARISVGWAF